MTASGPVRPRENSRGHENRRFPRASTSGDGGSAGRHDHGGRAKKYRRAARSKTGRAARRQLDCAQRAEGWRSEEHTSELQSLMRSTYAVFCLKKKNNKIYTPYDMTINSSKQD